jgi:hypothetical protein
MFDCIGALMNLPEKDGEALFFGGDTLVTIRITDGVPDQIISGLNLWALRRGMARSSGLSRSVARSTRLNALEDYVFWE